MQPAPALVLQSLIRTDWRRRVRLAASTEIHSGIRRVRKRADEKRDYVLLLSVQSPIILVCILRDMVWADACPRNGQVAGLPDVWGETGRCTCDNIA